MKKMLLAVGSVALSASSALAVPTLAPSPFPNSTVKMRGEKIIGYGRDVFRGSECLFRSGDMIIEGTDKKPAQLISEKLSVSAAKFFYSKTYGALHASSDATQTAPVKITGVFAPRSNRNSIRVEISCDTAKLTRSVWSLQGNVSGFYEDGSGRKPLSGDMVKLSAFDNAISIVQDGAISLSAEAAQ